MICVISPHLVEAWGVTGKFYSLNKEEVGGIISPGGSHHVLPLSMRDMQCKLKSNAAVFYQQSRGSPILPLIKLCCLALHWLCLHSFEVHPC